MKCARPASLHSPTQNATRMRDNSKRKKTSHDPRSQALPLRCGGTGTTTTKSKRKIEPVRSTNEKCEWVFFFHSERARCVSEMVQAEKKYVHVYLVRNDWRWEFSERGRATHGQHAAHTHTKWKNKLKKECDSRTEWYTRTQRKRVIYNRRKVVSYSKSKIKFSSQSEKNLLTLK